MSKRQSWPTEGQDKLLSDSSTIGISLQKHAVLVSLTLSQLWSPSKQPPPPDLTPFPWTKEARRGSRVLAQTVTNPLAHVDRCYSTMEITLQQCWHTIVCIQPCCHKRRLAIAITPRHGWTLKLVRVHTSAYSHKSHIGHTTPRS